MKIGLAGTSLLVGTSACAGACGCTGIVEYTSGQSGDCSSRILCKTGLCGRTCGCGCGSNCCTA